jgi:hypothetical protein
MLVLGRSRRWIRGGTCNPCPQHVFAVDAGEAMSPGEFGGCLEAHVATKISSARQAEDA